MTSLSLKGLRLYLDHLLGWWPYGRRWSWHKQGSWWLLYVVVKVINNLWCMMSCPALHGTSLSNVKVSFGLSWWHVLEKQYRVSKPCMDLQWRLARRWAVIVLWICQTRLLGTVAIDSAVDLPGFPALMPTIYRNPDLNLNPNMLLFAGKRAESEECSEVPLPAESLLSRAESTVKGDWRGMLLQGNRRSMNNTFTMKDTKSVRKGSLLFAVNGLLMRLFLPSPTFYLCLYTSSTA